MKKRHGTSEYRSGLEGLNGRFLIGLGVPLWYEEFKLVYTVPARQSTYTPDFLLPNGILVETKGRFPSSDRKKHLILKDEHPDLDLRFVFARPFNTLSKQSKTTYAEWASKHGFIWANKLIPIEWIEEPFNEKRFEALCRALKPTYEGKLHEILTSITKRTSVSLSAP